MSRHVALLGLTGSGKTTIGRIVAAALGRTFIDSDAVLEADHGRSGGDIAAGEGVAALHDLERSVTRQMLSNAVVAVLGIPASAIDDAATRDELAEGAWCFWLDADVATLARRMVHGVHRRPIPAAELHRLDAARRDWFSLVATARFDTGNSTAADIAAAIVAAVQRLEPPSTGPTGAGGGSVNR